MRTNIEIDNKLIREAKKISKANTKKEVVDIALRNYIKSKQQQKILDLFGKVKWEGNLKEMRSA